MLEPEPELEKGVVVEEVENATGIETTATYEESLNESGEERVVGSTHLYENGRLRLIPMPTPNPRDPLNLSERRKWFVIGVVAAFGSLALAAEAVIGGMISVFLLEYSGVDPKILNTEDFRTPGAINFNPLSVVPKGVKPVDIGRVAMLATIPFLTNGIASYFLVPVSIAIGRRPVMILMGMCAWIGGLWAGLSQSLSGHIIARALQGLGAGAVEALIPLIVQDVVFIHQRNKAMSCIVSFQGLFIITLGIVGPYVATVFTWRYLYFVTSGAASIAWVVMVLFLPETRWKRSSEELAGENVYKLQPGEDRPRINTDAYGPRKTTIALFQVGFEFKEAGLTMLDTLKTTFLPAIIWLVLANTAFIVVNSAVGQLCAFALLSQGIPFKYTGLNIVPYVLATALVYFLGGPWSDKVSLIITKRRGGAREPEYNLVNLILPFIFGIAGCFIFGYATQNNIHWAVIMCGAFCIVFGFLMLLTVTNAFIVECYPMWAGPVLVNVSSLRLIISFFITSSITKLVVRLGFMTTFAILAQPLVVLSLGIPLFWFVGKRLRIWSMRVLKVR